MQEPPGRSCTAGDDDTVHGTTGLVIPGALRPGCDLQPLAGMQQNVTWPDIDG
ncbi:MAG TPA: hypothetical protein VF834_12915 [Streptosporangiaceae bacterium]